MKYIELISKIQKELFKVNSKDTIRFLKGQRN